MKTCTKCGIEKPLDQFYRNKTKKHGRDSQCKVCCKDYEQSPEGKARRKKWLQSDQGKATVKAKHNPIKSREYTKKYRATENGKQTSKAYDNYYRTKYEHKYRAGVAVMHAVQSGRLIKPTNCERCGKEYYPLQGHHESYENEHWLDVIWLCPSCHKIIHLAIPQSSLH